MHPDRIMSVSLGGLGSIEFDGLLMENSTAYPRSMGATSMKFNNIVIRGSSNSAFSTQALSLTATLQAFKTRP